MLAPRFTGPLYLLRTGEDANGIPIEAEVIIQFPVRDWEVSTVLSKFYCESWSANSIKPNYRMPRLERPCYHLLYCRNRKTERKRNKNINTNDQLRDMPPMWVGHLPIRKTEVSSLV